MSWPALIEAADATVRAALGEPVAYKPGVGVTVVVQAVFDESYFKAMPDGGENGISTAVPAVFLRLSELSSDPASDLNLEIRRPPIAGKVYIAREVMPDGQGGVVILLREKP